MSLSVGQTLAHYEILGVLGAGGMGEVYRARDTRLEREVAIKVLPEGFVEDEERLRRFEREAKVLAALNHPHIDGIHGIDQQGDTCFLVLELVPGESLAERLAPGPLSVPEAIDVCRQIADGLEAAHEAGIVHRDLKPANVRITPEGTVKVLDFGLAKPRVKGASGENTPTAEPDSFLMTQQGVVLGTPTYMSPEQARGRPVDRRADIWAFGCVLYECLTGVRAFPGSQVLEILATVQEAEPDWTRLPSRTPLHVSQLLLRCLEKDPRRRLRDIGEARLALESPSASVQAVPAAAASAARTRSGTLPWILLGLAIAASIWAWSRPLTVEHRPREVTRFAIDFPLEDPQAFYQVNSVAVSPDGRQVAIAADLGPREGIFVRDLDRLDSRLLPDTSSSDDLVFSDDGRWIFFSRGDANELQRILVEGGKPVPYAPATDTTGITIDAEGNVVTTLVWGSGLSLISADGSVETLTSLDPTAGDRHHLAPRAMPGGEIVLFAIWTGGDWNETRIGALDLGTRRMEVIHEGGISPSYVELSSGGGALLWVRSESLWASRFDARRLELIGEPVQVVDGIEWTVGDGMALYHVSASGTLAYVPGGARMIENQLVWVDREGQEELVTNAVGGFQSPSLSRDGTRFAVVKEGHTFHVHGIDLTRTLEERVPRRLTFEADSYWSLLAPDGEKVLYAANPGGEYRLYTRPFDGASRPVQVLDRAMNPRSWSSDGEFVAFSHDGDVWICAMGEETLEPRIFLGTRANEYEPCFSPDGSWLAFVSNETGVSEIYVVSFPDGQRRFQITQAGGFDPRWSHDGSELFFRKDQKFYAVEVTTTPNFSAGAPKLMFSGNYGVDAANVGDLKPMPDGRFLMIKPLPADRDHLRVVVVENWVVELEERLVR